MKYCLGQYHKIKGDIYIFIKCHNILENQDEPICMSCSYKLLIGDYL